MSHRRVVVVGAGAAGLTIAIMFALGISRDQSTEVIFTTAIALALAAVPMAIVARVTAPFVWLLDRSSSLLLRLMGARHGGEAGVTAEELQPLLAPWHFMEQIQGIASEIPEPVRLGVS